MRKDSRFIILSIFVFTTSLIPRESLCAEATKVIIGMDAPTLSDLPLSVALKKDFDKAEGMNILQVLFRSGPTAMQALVSGSIQFSTRYAPPAEESKSTQAQARALQEAGFEGRLCLGKAYLRKSGCTDFPSKKFV